MSRLSDVERRCQEIWETLEPGVNALALGAEVPDLARDFRAVAEALRHGFPVATYEMWRATGDADAAARMDAYDSRRKAALALVDAWLNEETP